MSNPKCRHCNSDWTRFSYVKDHPEKPDFLVDIYECLSCLKTSMHNLREKIEISGLSFTKGGEEEKLEEEILSEEEKLEKIEKEETNSGEESREEDGEKEVQGEGAGEKEPTQD